MLLEPEDGPLWDTIKRQLYRSEVSHIKRLVGESLIQQNRVMWDELTSLRQILSDFEVQNDELTERSKKQVQFCGTQHRELLRRQAQILMDDLGAQIASCGYSLEDLVPELKSKHLRDFMVRQEPMKLPPTPSSRPTPPRTPSTRPPSSSGFSGCSSPDLGFAPLSLGRQLAVDELGAVAEGIREALEAESDSLLAAIGEEMQRFEAEDARRTFTAAGPAREPSTAELQQLVHKLQELILSPSLRSLAIAGPPSPSSGGGACVQQFDPSDGATLGARPITGGANVRRLKALIAQRRIDGVPGAPPLAAVPEAITATPVSSKACGQKPFDPFFDDPFA